MSLCSFLYFLDSLYLLSIADVTLDSRTASSQLILSEDGKQVRWEESDRPKNTRGFDTRACVLGKEGFTSGRHYWDVELNGNSLWRLGVTTQSAQRKRWFSINPQSGYWTLVLWYGNQFKALSSPETLIPLCLKPRKMRVYVDYEHGQISFYNPETGSLIYTFIDTFTDQLYPFFCTVDNRDLIIVSPVVT